MQRVVVIRYIMLQSIKRAATRAAVTAAIASMLTVPFTTPLAARAELVSGYAQPPDASVQGTISSIPGKYEILVRDDTGSLNNVELHKGTIINPTGIALKPGFNVTIYGHPRDDRFVADEIDTPYRYDESNDVYAPYPYPYYMYPYAGLVPMAIVIIRR